MPEDSHGRVRIETVSATVITFPGSEDGTIRLWPMPDLSKPPLHTLPHNALLAKLKSLTNVRAVRDPSSDTGWKLEIPLETTLRDVYRSQV